MCPGRYIFFRLWCCVCLIVLLAPARRAPADVIILTSGMRLEGSILSETDSEVVIDRAGTKLRIKRTRIASIERESAATESLKRAQVFEKSGKHLKALKEYGARLAEKPDLPEAKSGMRRCTDALKTEFCKTYAKEFKRKDYPALRKILAATIAGAPDAAERNVYQELLVDLELTAGKMQQDSLQTSDAEKSFDAAVSALPDYPAARLERARFFMQQQRWTDARADLDKCLSLDPECFEGRLLLMETCLQTNQHEQLLEQYERASAEKNISENGKNTLAAYKIKLTAPLAMGRRARALKLADAGQREKALEDYKAASAVIPESKATLLEDAAFYKKLGDAPALAKVEKSLAQFRQREIRLAEAHAKTAEANVKAVTAMVGKPISAKTYTSAVKAAEQHKRNILLVLETDWCMYCKKLTKEVLPQSNVKNSLKNYVQLKLDAEKGEGRQLAARFRSDGYPHIIVLSSTGKLLREMRGCPSDTNSFAQWLK